jgi:hypothetical protein
MADMRLPAQLQGGPLGQAKGRPETACLGVDHFYNPARIKPPLPLQFRPSTQINGVTRSHSLHERLPKREPDASIVSVGQILVSSCGVLADLRASPHSLGKSSP